MNQSSPLLAKSAKNISKILKLVFIFIPMQLTINNCFCQEYAGFRSGNYSGVNGVFFNPANIADSRHSFDLSLFSIHALNGNNKASFTFSDFRNSFNIDSIKSQLYGNSEGLSSGMINLDLHGPSLMIRTGKNSSVALTSRFRAMLNSIDMDGRLVSGLLGTEANDGSKDYSISSLQKMLVVQNAWTEYGLSYARIIHHKGPHFIKAGISLKYIRGIANAHISLEQVKGNLNEEPGEGAYLSSASARVAIGSYGVNLSEFEFDKLKQKSGQGLGADIGFVYEWRPEFNYDKKDEEGASSPDLNKYKLKIGIAVMDFGRFKYKKDNASSGNYEFNVTPDERFYLDELNEVSLQDYETYMRNKPEFFTPSTGTGSNNPIVKLPSTLQFSADYHFKRGFYLNIEAQLPLSKKSNKPADNRLYKSVIITPRFEGKWFGIYFPLTFNELTKMNSGVALRAGQIFAGSGSLISAFFSHSKQADVYVGFRIGSLRKKK